jgi:hypothetical protein
MSYNGLYSPDDVGKSSNPNSIPNQKMRARVGEDSRAKVAMAQMKQAKRGAQQRNQPAPKTLEQKNAGFDRPSPFVKGPIQGINYNTRQRSSAASEPVAPSDSMKKARSMQRLHRALNPGLKWFK